jgi:hypothetical protein
VIEIESKYQCSPIHDNSYESGEELTGGSSTGVEAGAAAAADPNAAECGSRVEETFSGTIGPPKPLSDLKMPKVTFVGRWWRANTTARAAQKEQAQYSSC